MREQRRMVKAARWLVMWVVFTVAMRFVTDFAGIYRGWVNTAVTSASVVAFWFLVAWRRHNAADVKQPRAVRPPPS
ncbi:hypothetical protein ACFYZ8_38215 [Streptomyces sp. NPDC001668]|uniref:hypothetical protein n=1 Tax=unclassified Streptomyces TaxID=2593676 RepID=UPI00369571EC